MTSNGYTVQKTQIDPVFCDSMVPHHSTCFHMVPLGSRQITSENLMSSIASYAGPARLRSPVSSSSRCTTDGKTDGQSFWGTRRHKYSIPCFKTSCFKGGICRERPRMLCQSVIVGGVKALALQQPHFEVAKRNRIDPKKIQRGQQID